MVAAKGAVKELRRGREALEKSGKRAQRKGGVSGKGTGNGKGTAGAQRSGPGSQFFEHVPTPGMGNEVPLKAITDQGRISDFSPQEPFMVEVAGGLKEVCDDADVVAFVSQFVQIYNGNAKRTSAEGRAVQRMVASSGMFEKAKTTIIGILPQQALQSVMAMPLWLRCWARRPTPSRLTASTSAASVSTWHACACRAVAGPRLW